MRVPRSPKRLLRRRGQALSPLQVLASLAMLLAADFACQQIGGESIFPAGPLDEIAHFLTALLFLQWLPARQRAHLGGPALLASVAIDLDHVPQYLGDQFLTAGTPRPYTHSLVTVAVLLALAAALSRHRRLLAGLALGVILHFVRDLSEGGSSAVSLLWPFTDHGYSYPHAAYVGLMAAVAAAAACAGLLSPRRRARRPRRTHHRQASRASA